MAEYMTLEVHIDGGGGSRSKMGRGNRKVKSKSEEGQIKELNKAITMTTGFATTAISMANSVVGAYTGNKLRQSNNQTTINMLATGVSFVTALATQNYVGAIAIYVGTVLSTVRSSVNYFVNDVNSKQESTYRMAYKGNPTTSGSRFRGEKR